MGAQQLLGKETSLHPRDLQMIAYLLSVGGDSRNRRPFKSGPPDFNKPLLKMAQRRAAELEGEADRYDEAVRIVVEIGKASTSTLQRRLRLGYGRAARLIDMMERDGIVGPADGSKPRSAKRKTILGAG
jgi:DNA segregation ATPase FtsK/SpoIIIE-like protein